MVKSLATVLRVMVIISLPQHLMVKVQGGLWNELLKKQDANARRLII